MHDRDSAAKFLLPLIAISLLVGILAIGGHYLFTGKAYSVDFCLKSNQQAGFYPYIPPVAKKNRDR